LTFPLFALPATTLAVVALAQLVNPGAPTNRSASLFPRAALATILAAVALDSSPEPPGAQLPTLVQLFLLNAPTITTTVETASALPLDSPGALLPEPVSTFPTAALLTTIAELV
jgi:hypothetical protein